MLLDKIFENVDNLKNKDEYYLLKNTIKYLFEIWMAFENSSEEVLMWNIESGDPIIDNPILIHKNEIYKAIDTLKRLKLHLILSESKGETNE